MNMKLNKDGLIIPDENLVVNRTLPEIDECRNILLHVVKQAIDDVQDYRFKTKLEHVEIYQSAHSFLFDDDYFIDWGDNEDGSFTELNLEQICELLNLDIDWIRQKISEQIEVELKKDGVVAIKRKKPYAKKL